MLTFPPDGDDREVVVPFSSEAAMDAAFPDGTFTLHYNNTSTSSSSDADGMRSSSSSQQQVVLDKTTSPLTHYPPPITIELWQDGKRTAPSSIAPGVDMTIHWTNFSNGCTHKLCADLIFVQVGDCNGTSLLWSGEPFDPVGPPPLTYANQSFVVPGLLLLPGQTFQLSVEQSKKLPSYDKVLEIAALPCFEATTFLDVNTTGTRHRRRSTRAAPQWSLHGGRPTRALQTPRGSLYGGFANSTGVAPRGLCKLHEGVADLFYTDVRSILMVLRLHFKGTEPC